MTAAPLRLVVAGQVLEALDGGYTFTDYLYDQGLARRTVRIYQRLAERAHMWCVERGLDLVTLRGEPLRRLADELVPDTSTSRRQLRSALAFYWTMHGVTDPPVKGIRTPPKPRYRWRGIEAEESAALIEAAYGWYPEGTMVLLGMFLALRREELATARWDRFDPEWEWYTVHGKRDVVATLPVHPALSDELAAIRPGVAAIHRSKAYSALVAQPSAYVFPDRKQTGPVCGATVQIWLAKVCDAAGIKRITPHQMRHTAIADIHDRTGDLYLAQQFARHADIETTTVYTRVTPDRLRTAVRTLYTT